MFEFHQVQMSESNQTMVSSVCERSSNSAGNACENYFQYVLIQRLRPCSVEQHLAPMHNARTSLICSEPLHKTLASATSLFECSIPSRQVESALARASRSPALIV